MLLPAFSKLQPKNWRPAIVRLFACCKLKFQKRPAIVPLLCLLTLLLFFFFLYLLSLFVCCCCCALVDKNTPIHCDSYKNQIKKYCQKKLQVPKFEGIKITKAKMASNLLTYELQKCPAIVPLLCLLTLLLFFSFFI